MSKALNRWFNSRNSCLLRMSLGASGRIKISPFQRPTSPAIYLGGPSGGCVKSKQSDMLSAEPSR